MGQASGNELPQMQLTEANAALVVQQIALLRVRVNCHTVDGLSTYSHTVAAHCDTILPCTVHAAVTNACVQGHHWWSWLAASLQQSQPTTLFLCYEVCLGVVENWVDAVCGDHVLVHLKRAVCSRC